MLGDLFLRPHVAQRIRENPIGSVIEEFVEYLTARGYGRATMYQYVFVVEHLGKWLGGRPINREAVERFLKKHVPSCRCTRPAPRRSRSTAAALNRLLDMLGCEAATAPSDSVSESLLRRYADHLTEVQGLAAATVHYRLRYARAMLTTFRVRRLAQLKAWTAEAIRRFVAREGRRGCPASGQVIASSLRSFLRFLLLHRLLDRDLAAAVPGFANWRLASLPETVSDEQLEHLVSAIDTSTPLGLRNRAIVLCLVDLGLRASDVARLEIDGVDIAARALRLRRPKQRHATVVPMTRRLASAVNAYLRRGRPPCSSSTLFVIHRAPRGKALTSAGIERVVISQAADAGLAHCIRGTHVIRHSAASRWLQAGATLKQIADLLGHRSIDTTSIYAKIDLAALTQVAMPWPTSQEETR